MFFVCFFFKSAKDSVSKRDFEKVHNQLRSALTTVDSLNQQLQHSQEDAAKHLREENLSKARELEQLNYQVGQLTREVQVKTQTKKFFFPFSICISFVI